VKRVVREPESDNLRRHLRTHQPLVSSALARTEVVRALLGWGEPAVRLASDVLASVDLIAVSGPVLTAAGTLSPAEVRSLEAIHPPLSGWARTSTTS
jgi:hypothetical protein